MKGMYFSIEEFSVYDGPGIRTSVFLKGCPLRCTWCHNPEGQVYGRQIVRSPNGCIGCNNCIKYAEQTANGPAFTEKSIENCPGGLLRYCGEECEPGELCEKLLKNASILGKVGGVTFSGGEPFAQRDFLFECLGKLKGKVHTAIQTCGYTDADTFRQALTLCDFMLFDIKIMDDDLHRKYTGVSNERILENFIQLKNSGLDFVVRIPLIPGVSDTESNIRQSCEFFKENGVDYVELLPYNKMAGGKYKMLSRSYDPKFDTEAQVHLHPEIFSEYGIKTAVL